MKLLQAMLGWCVTLLLASSVAAAADFGWVRDFNGKAEADMRGFRAKLAARFPIGEVRIDALLQNVDRPADAYIVLRFGEMARRPPEEILKSYRAKKGKGWGAIAKNLGIRSGSKEFYALKRGQSLFDGGAKAGRAKPQKGKGKKPPPKKQDDPQR